MIYTVKRFSVLALMVLLLVYTAKAQQQEKTHKVKRGETLYSIATQYGTTPEQLIKANPSLEKKEKVRAGQKLVIPAPPPVRPAAPAPVVKDSVPVQPKAPAPAEETKFPKADPVPAQLKTNSGKPAEYPAIFSRYASGGFRMQKTRGAANFLGDQTSGNSYLAFYNNAETGSIIKVVNLMNKRVAYVKVVGRLPLADTSREIVIKLSRKVAAELGAVDEKFLVEVIGYTQPLPPKPATPATPQKR